MKQAVFGVVQRSHYYLCLKVIILTNFDDSLKIIYPCYLTQLASWTSSILAQNFNNPPPQQNLIFGSILERREK